MDLKKKQAVIRLQKAFRSWLRRKAFRTIGIIPSFIFYYCFLFYYLF